MLKPENVELMFNLCLVPVCVITLMIVWSF